MTGVCRVCGQDEERLRLLRDEAMRLGSIEMDLINMEGQLAMEQAETSLWRERALVLRNAFRRISEFNPVSGSHLDAVVDIARELANRGWDGEPLEEVDSDG